MSFVAPLEAFLDIELDRPVSPWPVHRVGLMPVRVSTSVNWRCPEGDFECGVGDYQEDALPPRLDENPGRLWPDARAPL